MRRGLAIPLVICFLLLVIPLVFTLAVRSSSGLRAALRTEQQREARELAIQAESAALTALAAGTPALTALQSTPDGGHAYQMRPAGTGDAGEPLYFLAAEGVHQGEERIVMSTVEVHPPAAAGRPNELVVRDRTWLFSERGGGLVDLLALSSQHSARVDAFVRFTAVESAVPADQFVNRLLTQADQLDCPDIAGERAQIEAQLRRAYYR